MFYYFKELASTIDEAADAGYVHGDVVVAEFQTAGRGQRGNRWSSAAGQNLMFSVVLDSSFLGAGEQFLLLQTVAVALVDTMAEYGLDARVKWTNDIYIGDRKITGVLIDHTHGPGGKLRRSGVGVGINVNQTVFEDWLPNPTSMALEAGREFDRREVLERFHAHIMKLYELLRAGEGEEIRKKYHEKIYRRDTLARFALPDGTGFSGTIRGVAPGGELLVDDPAGGAQKSFLFREVSFVI
ncbi:MAG: biotin--[acetyl-CoA-carboxylase] ligase [Alistipes sp.]|jgi:BirA family biotin operon repressor/biotin-[acetyl-CoA-carboxylase] ligase|nr:biotin--[acetyl-CoA-carboxylase] ligase [Alistipes sp.]